MVVSYSHNKVSSHNILHSSVDVNKLIFFEQGRVRSPGLILLPFYGRKLQS
jgi:hypothetical protein